jgi:hypothetical protein
VIAYVSAFLWFINSILELVDKKSPVMRPNLQPKIYKSPVVAYQLYHMYATTRYNFVPLNLPLRRVGRGEISPLAVPRG